MSELITLKTSEGGKKTVSAKELYLGLGLASAAWSRWSKVNIKSNDFFKENYDWQGVQHEVEGNETMDFEISLEFAKHIAMMARTEKSHQYRNYFLVCEAKLKEQQNMIPVPKLSKEIQAIFVLDEKQQKLETKVNNLVDNMPLFNAECKELQSLVRKKGIEVLGGYKSTAYNDNSLRQKIYGDIQRQIKREFGVNRYEAIKRSQYVQAKNIIAYYVLPLILEDEVALLNNQVKFNNAI